MRLIAGTILLFFPLGLSGQETFEILRNAVKVNSEHKSMMYDISYALKGVDDIDTTRHAASVFLMKDASSTSLFRIQLDNGDIIIYDRANVIYGKQNSSKVVKKPAKATSTNKEWPAISPFYSSRLLLKEFGQPDIVDYYIKNCSIERLLDTTINGTSCYQVMVRHNKNTSIKHDDDWEILYSIDKRSQLPLYRRILTLVNGSYQYETLLITDYSFDNVDASFFKVSTKVE